MTDDVTHIETADASPAKRFFISMLIRDIELIPSIVDLVDNSVDAAHAQLEAARATAEADRPVALNPVVTAAENAIGGVPPTVDLSGYWVKIVVRPDRFEIQDNCGGIDLDLAEKYAFRFGRAEDFPGSPQAVGQFGVGMKRALFKLGTRFVVRSLSQASKFNLPVDVDAWAQKPEWTFEFDEAVHRYDPTPDEVRGCTIRVDRLHPSVSDDFGSANILGRLRLDIQLRHQPALDAGMRIELNGNALLSTRPELAASNLISPVYVHETLRTDGGTIEMRLYAGVLASPDADAGDDLEPEEFPSTSQAGWNLFCNNRLLLVADTSELTGWGDGAAAYHPQYRGFRGYVYLDGDSALLPWNTTKTGVDRDSRVFRLAKAQMVAALRNVQTFLNQAKNEAQRLPAEDRVIAPAIALAQASPLSTLTLSPTMTYPAPSRRRPEDTIRRIAYAVPKEDFDAVAGAVGSTSAPEVGRKTFQYFLETQVDR